MNNFLNSEQKIIYAKKRANNFLNNAEYKIILCKIVKIVYTENSEQFLWENNEQSIYIYIYIIAETERKWIPTIKEVVTNRKKNPLKY